MADDPALESEGPGPVQFSGEGAFGPAGAGSSIRTLILGIDYDGRIVQHDRSAPRILAREPDELLGAKLTDLTTAATAVPSSSGSAPDTDSAAEDRAAPPASGERQAEAVAALLDAIRSDREGSGMLTVQLLGGQTADAVVRVHPMRASGTSLAALVLLHIPAPSEERFVDPAMMRRQMLDDTFNKIGDTLDIDHLARILMDALVPSFCNTGELLLLESLIGNDELPAHGPDGSHQLRRIALSHDRKDPAWEAAFPTGEILRYPEHSPYYRCMETGKPILDATITDGQASSIAKAWRRKPVSKLLSGASMALLPLLGHGGTMLGFLACIRQDGYRRFDAYDIEVAKDFAARASVFVDNARRFNREHATALTLQRSMLPTGLSAPSSVEVKHRYLPGSKLIEVGGDWYESIALPGARVALVVGDVAGHGVRAAVTMGRIRTAIHTLAMLELPPVETLQQLDELMHTLGEREPHFATCAYAVYDAVSGSCEVAVAGHLPPLLVFPDGHNEYLDVPPSPPLGIGDGETESRQFTVEDGSLFVLYTDGLVENKGQDISDGLARLQGIFGVGSTDKPLEDLCKATLDGVYSDQERDDIAVLIARLRRLPAESYATWKLPPKLTSVRKARSAIVEPMSRWGLDDLLPTTELLVSELVTNAMRYSRGEVTLRLVNERALVCEVHDSSGAMPRLRQATDDDEHGRGLQVVRLLAKRWGARRTATGKVVWCEQQLPGSPGLIDLGG
ncbi:MAG TPA: ATP-binding SpoIIE family protein phosphatase, partial [Streptosporangiaceae bacterium]|nr:ATP-binding SpoIIE family protein phosphatase [Streptosporangiaceae bacterium]